jgi:hypothetical protein
LGTRSGGVGTVRFNTEHDQGHGDALLDLVGKIINGLCGDGAQRIALFGGQFVLSEDAFRVVEKLFAEILVDHCTAYDLAGILLAHGLSPFFLTVFFIDACILAVQVGYPYELAYRAG